jgi:hypothetical protein
VVRALVPTLLPFGRGSARLLAMWAVLWLAAVPGAAETVAPPEPAKAPAEAGTTASSNAQPDESAATEPVAASAANASVETKPTAARKTRIDWSATLFASGKIISPPEDNDGVGGFFDQYEFTANKSAAFPVNLGVREASFDVVDELDDALFQLRLMSPTSNLGVSGPQIDQPFFNQRVETWTRVDAWALDLDYRRMRTEELRRFPNTEGGGLVFDDMTAQDARFERDRTGMLGELRRRFGGARGPVDAGGKGVSSEIALRGGFDARSGLNQLLALRGPQNDWLGLPQGADRNISDVGAGVLVGSRATPAWMLTVDFDYQQLRWTSPTIFESSLGTPPPAGLRTLGFIPDSNRLTGRIDSRGRLAGAVDWRLGYQLSVLEQVDDFTPDQQIAGLEDNDVWLHSVAGSLRWSPWSPISLSVDLDFDLRDNRIDRNTPLFNANDGTQVDAFVDDWRRFVGVFEAETRFLHRNTVTLGVRYEDVSRSLEFSDANAPKVLPPNSIVSDTTRFIGVYGRTRLNPWRRLRLSGELGYRAAPKVGYVTNLDNFVYGQVDARWVLGTPRPVVLTALVRGDSGENDGVDMVEGLGPTPPGPDVQRRFDRWTLGWGVGVETSPIERLSLYASFLCGRLNQDSGVMLSTVQRYFQDQIPLTFTDIGLDGYQSQHKILTLGASREWRAGFDTGLSYTYTFAHAEYNTGGVQQLDLIAENRAIDNKTQVLNFEAGWRPQPGLRLLAGYRFQWNRDGESPPQSIASSATPINNDALQHTITLGVSLDGSLFDRRD